MSDDDLILVRRGDLRDLLLDTATREQRTTSDQRQAMWAAVNGPPDGDDNMIVARERPFLAQWEPPPEDEPCQ